MAEANPTTAYDVLMFIRDWFGPTVGGGALLLVWRLSKGWTEMQGDHSALKADDEFDKEHTKLNEGKTEAVLT